MSVCICIEGAKLWLALHWLRETHVEMNFKARSVVIRSLSTHVSTRSEQGAKDSIEFRGKPGTTPLQDV